MDENNQRLTKHLEKEGVEPLDNSGRKAEKALVPPRPAARRREIRRWGVILAGGDGTRLQRLTRLIYGEERPKQFCALIGAETLLEQTRLRTERNIAAHQIAVALTKSHRSFYLQESGIRPAQRIIQPANKGTAPAILYSLLSIERNDPDAIVAILPADHHYSAERNFDSALDRAFDVAAKDTNSVVIFGAQPEYPEIEYGWIELGSFVRSGDKDLFSVRRFCEKPPLAAAQQLLEQGSLWNTFVMVGHVKIFLEMMESTLPDLVNFFRVTRKWIGTEAHIEDSFYNSINSLDFSRAVLSLQPRRLTALKLAKAGWSDLGHPERVIAAVEAAGLRPEWMSIWKAQRQAPAPATVAAALAIA